MHKINLRAEIRKGETPNRKLRASHCTTIALHYEQLIECVTGFELRHILRIGCKIYQI